MMKTLLPILSFLFLISYGCTSSKNLVESYLKINPPGTTKARENYFVDKMEVSNIAWREYQYYLEKVFGKNSKEYRSALPQNNTWLNLHPSLENFDSVYISHIAYQDHPVVGITLEQAKDYSKWRSNRVFEFILIRDGVIEMNSTQNSDNYFTIEKYFKGQYLQYLPDSNHMYYPVYSIPSQQEYLSIIPFADSLNAANIDHCKSKYCESIHLNDQYCNSPIINYADSLLILSDQTLKGRCSFCKDEIISHLKSNVQEFTTDPTKVFGMNFKDSCTTDPYQFRIDTSKSNAYTGFRNVCTFKKWE